MIPWRVLYTMWVLCYKDIVVVVSKIQLQKIKWVKKWIEINAIKAKGGGVWHSVANAIKNFHIFLKTSLSNAVRSMKSEELSPLSSCKRFLIILSMLSKEPVPLWRLSVRKTQVCWHLFMLANDKKASAKTTKTESWGWDFSENTWPYLLSSSFSSFPPSSPCTAWPTCWPRQGASTSQRSEFLRSSPWARTAKWSTWSKWL